jgi:hypothetical protein
MCLLEQAISFSATVCDCKYFKSANLNLKVVKLAGSYPLEVALYSHILEESQHHTEELWEHCTHLPR